MKIHLVCKQKFLCSTAILRKKFGNFESCVCLLEVGFAFLQICATALQLKKQNFGNKKDVKRHAFLVEYVVESCLACKRLALANGLLNVGRQFFQRAVVVDDKRWVGKN